MNRYLLTLPSVRRLTRADRLLSCHPAPGLRRLACAWLMATLAAPAWALTVPATQDLSCALARQSPLNCTANDFTVGATFSAAPGTAPFCVAGQSFSFEVDLNLTSNSPDRYDVGFFVGQNGNNPQTDASPTGCSVGTVPTTAIPAPPPTLTQPWFKAAGNAGNLCSDFLGNGASTTITFNQIKVQCQGDSTGALTIPYLLAYSQSSGDACTGPGDVKPGSGSKCQVNTAAPVSGLVAVFAGGYVDVTKQTTPDGDNQPFIFTATGPLGAKVIALTGAVLTPTSATGGTYSPSSIATATNTASATLRDGETVRFYMNVLPIVRTLTITETAASNWESTAAISCAAVTGSPLLITNNATRTLTAGLSTTNIAAACTVTNTKRPRITLAKSVGGRVSVSDQFTVSASGGGTLTGSTSATTSGTASTASTLFYSTPSTALTIADSKAAGPTPLSEYDSRLTCSNAFTGPGATPGASLPSNVATTSASLTPAPGDDLVCTFTNTPRPRITLQKIIDPAGGGRVAVTDQFTLAVTGATPVITTGIGNSITSAGVSLVTTAGVALTLSESAAGTTDLANYAAAYSCTNSGSGGTTVPPGSGTSFVVAPVNNDVIACNFTNTRRSAELTLAKRWTNATLNNAVIISAIGLNSRNFAATANTRNETDTDTGTMTIYAGETVALAEAFTTGLPLDYAKSLTCTGNNGALSHIPDSLTGTLAINGADTQITCTFSNDKLMPSLTFLKSVQVTSDPVNLALNPKYIPGAEALYTLTVTNSGPGAVDNTSLIIVDPVPVNTVLFTGNLGGGAPFNFSNGTLPSGVVCNFNTLGDFTDCVDFSVDGVNWTYVPNGSFDPAVTHIRFTPVGAMNADAIAGNPSPSFSLQFRVRVK